MQLNSCPHFQDWKIRTKIKERLIITHIWPLQSYEAHINLDNFSNANIHKLTDIIIQLQTYIAISIFL